jgi:hypothetical protein
VKLRCDGCALALGSRQPIANRHPERRPEYDRIPQNPLLELWAGNWLSGEAERIVREELEALKWSTLDFERHRKGDAAKLKIDIGLPAMQELNPRAGSGKILDQKGSRW